MSQPDNVSVTQSCIDDLHNNAYYTADVPFIYWRDNAVNIIKEWHAIERSGAPNHRIFEMPDGNVLRVISKGAGLCAVTMDV